MLRNERPPALSIFFTNSCYVLLLHRHHQRLSKCRIQYLHLLPHTYAFAPHRDVCQLFHPVLIVQPAVVDPLPGLSVESTVIQPELLGEMDIECVIYSS